MGMEVIQHMAREVILRSSKSAGVESLLIDDRSSVGSHSYSRAPSDAFGVVLSTMRTKRRLHTVDLIVSL